MTVTYGKDEAAKHPTIFNSADVAVITKIDLAAAVEFNAAAANCSIQAVRPGMTVLDAAAKSDGGMEQFLDLAKKAAQPRSRRCRLGKYRSVRGARPLARGRAQRRRPTQK